MTIEVILMLATLWFIPISIIIDYGIKERKLNKKIKSIRIGQKYVDEANYKNPFNRGTDIKTVIDIKEGYILYADNSGFYKSTTLRNFARNYVLINS